MFSWINRVRTAPPPRRARLALEKLEDRDCPSLGTQPNEMLWYVLNTTPPPAITPPAIHPVMSPSEDLGPGGASGPVITLNLTYNGQTSITLSGMVTDSLASVSGLVVTFSGEVSASTLTNSNGFYSITINASGLGTISASTVDGIGLVSNTPVVNVTSTAPVISNFSWVEGYNAIFTFSGTVTDASPSGLTVNFGGIPSLEGQTATVESNGSFEIIVQLNPNGSDNGESTAQVTNWWGQQSNLAQSLVSVTP